MIHHNDHFIFKIHFMFKIMLLCVGSGFLVSHCGLRKPIHQWGLYLTIISGLFTRGRIYLFFLIPDTYFLYHFNQSCDSVGCSPIYRAHPIKHQTQCRFTNHALTHLNRCTRAYAMYAHCVSITCLICNEFHVDHTSHASHHAFWTIITHSYNFQTSFL